MRATSAREVPPEKCKKSGEPSVLLTTVGFDRPATLITLSRNAQTLSRRANVRSTLRFNSKKSGRRCEFAPPTMPPSW